MMRIEHEIEAHAHLDFTRVHVPVPQAAPYKKRIRDLSPAASVRRGGVQQTMDAHSTRSVTRHALTARKPP